MSKIQIDTEKLEEWNNILGETRNVILDLNYLNSKDANYEGILKSTITNLRVAIKTVKEGISGILFDEVRKEIVQKQ